MLKIKLTRTGKKKQPSYRIVIAEARSKRDGKFVENLGTYNPLQKKTKVKINRERFDYWIKKGAQPTETVRRLYKKILKTKD